jgi:hypothetical protein
MKRAEMICIVALCAVVLAPLFAYGASGPGPVKITFMSRVESHTKVGDLNNPGVYSGNSYAYNMLSATRVLQKSVIGNIFYLNQYDIDNGRTLTHIGGVTVIKMFSPKWVGTLGYTYSSNPQLQVFVPVENQDRFSASALFNVNPKSKKVKYSLLTNYGTVTGFNNQRTVSERADATFKIFNKRFTENLGYTYTYGIDKDANGNRLGQLTNQYASNLSYTLCKDTKLVLGYLYINKVFDSSTPDDSVARLTLMHNFK